MDLKKAVSTLSGVPHTRLIATDIWHNRIGNMLEDNASVNDIREMDHAFMFEVPELENVPTTKKPPSNPYRNNALANPYSSEPGSSANPNEPEEKDDKDNKDENDGKKVKQTRSPILAVDYVVVQIHQYTMEKNPHWSPDWTYSKEYTHKQLAFPQLIVLPLSKPMTRGQIAAIIHEQVKHLIKPGDVQTDAKPYQIVQLDSDGRNCLTCPYNVICYGHELTEDDKEFQIQVRFKDAQFSFGCIWNEPEKFFAAEKVSDYVRHSSSQQEEGAKKDTLDLGECIKAFCLPETLSEEDPWYCNVCKEHKRAQKKNGYMEIA